MCVRYVCSAASAAVFTIGIAAAQTSQPAPTSAQADSKGEPITVIGCIQREADYRRATDAGRGGVAATGGDAYELTGSRERDLAKLVGRRVEVTGTLKRAETAVGTSGAATAKPTGGFDPLRQDLRLFELDVTSFREVGAAPAAPPEPAAPPPPAADQVPAQPATPEPRQPATTGAQEQLPRTASPLALVGFTGLLTLGGVVGIRSYRRRR